MKNRYKRLKILLNIYFPLLKLFYCTSITFSKNLNIGANSNCAYRKQQHVKSITVIMPNNFITKLYSKTLLQQTINYIVTLFIHNFKLLCLFKKLRFNFK